MSRGPACHRTPLPGLLADLSFGLGRSVAPLQAIWADETRWSRDLGAITRMPSVFAGAASVAITSTGQVYVAELLSGKISVVRSSGLIRPYLSLPGVTALTAVGTTLYAAVAAPVSMGVRTGPGRIVRIG